MSTKWINIHRSCYTFIVTETGSRINVDPGPKQPRTSLRTTPLCFGQCCVY